MEELAMNAGGGWISKVAVFWLHKGRKPELVGLNPTSSNQNGIRND